jgi:hypothetical protein
MYRRTAGCRSRAERETAVTAKFSRIVRLIGLAVVVGTLAAGTATAAPTPQGLKADGLRMQGIADAYQRMQTPPAASFYTPQALKAQGLRWQGIAQMFAAERASASSTSSSGFDWSAAVIGGASTLGFATVGVALLLGARRVRRTSVAV